VLIKPLAMLLLVALLRKLLLLVMKPAMLVLRMVTSMAELKAKTITISQYHQYINTHPNELVKRSV
jgi:hypothetical protein